MLKELQELLVDVLIGLAEVSSSLRVADDDVLDACILQHCRGDLSGECTLLLEIDVLCAQMDIGSCDSLLDRDDIDRRDTVDNIDLRILDQRLQSLTKRYCLSGGHVHLPVAGDNFLSHWNHSPF